MTDIVIVETPPAEPAGESAPPVVVEAVSPGELAARLELLETSLGERISMALDEAFSARATAEQAQETAEVAAVVAAVAAESAAESEDDSGGAAEDEGSGAEGAESETEDEGVRPPERRQEQAQKDTDGGNRETAKKSTGYGAGFLSGR